MSKALTTVTGLAGNVAAQLSAAQSSVIGAAITTLLSGDRSVFADTIKEMPSAKGGKALAARIAIVYVDAVSTLIRGGKPVNVQTLCTAAANAALDDNGAELAAGPFLENLSGHSLPTMAALWQEKGARTQAMKDAAEIVSLDLGKSFASVFTCFLEVEKKAQKLKSDAKKEEKKAEAEAAEKLAKESEEAAQAGRVDGAAIITQLTLECDSLRDQVSSLKTELEYYKGKAHAAEVLSRRLGAELESAALASMVQRVDAQQSAATVTQGAKPKRIKQSA